MCLEGMMNKQTQQISKNYYKASFVWETHHTLNNKISLKSWAMRMVNSLTSKSNVFY